MTVILLRHGRSTSNTAHTLAGRTEGVELDEKGAAQAAALVERLEGLLRSNIGRVERRFNPVEGPSVEHRLGTDFPLLIALIRVAPGVQAELPTMLPKLIFCRSPRGWWIPTTAAPLATGLASQPANTAPAGAASLSSSRLASGEAEV